MNLHPLIVHFPIALLTTYIALELIRVKRVLRMPSWFTLKAFLVITGALGAGFAFLTGDTAEHLARGNDVVRAVVHYHSFFAGLTTALFVSVALAYLIGLVRRTVPILIAESGGWRGTALRFSVFYERFVLETPMLAVLVILGLVALTVTGALGGIMVYGSNVDPFAAFVSRIVLGK